MVQLKGASVVGAAPCPLQVGTLTHVASTLVRDSVRLISAQGYRDNIRLIRAELMIIGVLFISNQSKNNRKDNRYDIFVKKTLQYFFNLSLKTKEKIEQITQTTIIATMIITCTLIIS